MSLLSSFRSLLFRPSHLQARPAHPGRPRLFRPALEALEDRQLLSGPGTLDPTFGSGGEVLGTFANSARDVKIQSDGKILVAGKNNDDGNFSAFALARYNAADGSLDPTFGSGGKVIATLGGRNGSGASELVIQPDGKILAAGYAYVGNSRNARKEFALVRYNANGSLDSTFGSGGKVFTAIGTDDTAYAVLVQNDGKIVAAGYTLVNGNTDFGLVRYNTNGTLDSTFGSGGKVITAISTGTNQGSYLNGLALETVLVNGAPVIKIVAAGQWYNGSRNYFALARYNPDGTLDGSFGQGGVVTTAVGQRSSAYDIAVQPADGKIVVAGADNNGANLDFAVARYNTDGSLDTTFNATGAQPGVAPLDGTQSEIAYATALQTDGKIVVAGVQTPPNSSYVGDTALARFNADGTADTSFGTNGLVVTALSGEDDAQGLALQADGKIVTAGFYNESSTYTGSWAILRYLSDTPPAGTSKTVTTTSFSSPPVTAAQIDPGLVDLFAHSIPTHPSPVEVAQPGTLLRSRSNATAGGEVTGTGPVELRRNLSSPAHSHAEAHAAIDHIFGWEEFHPDLSGVPLDNHAMNINADQDMAAPSSGLLDVPPGH